MGDTDSHCASSTELTVLIRCPLLLADNQLRCSLDKGSTIRQLKDSITTQLDCRPAASEQRLIFCGRILEDTETLERVFEKIDCTTIPPTVHLVVSQAYLRSFHTSSAPSSPLPLRSSVSQSNIDNNHSHTSSTAMASSAPNAADTRASSAPPSSSSIPPLGSNPSTTAAAASSSQGSTATDNSKAQEAASTQPPPYSYTPVLPWTNPLQQTLLQPYQYVIVNGMPYLMPAGYMPFFQQQQHHHHQQQAIFGYPMAYGSMMVMNADGSTTFVNSHMTHDQLRTAATGTGVTTASVAAPGAVPEGGAGAGEAAPAVAALNPQEIAARDQRRAASIWLLMKLAFGVYLFGQNGSLERKVLLNIAALIIFLHQTGRLRIVRRIAPANLDDQANMDGNRQQAGAAQAGQDGGAGEAGPSGTRSADASSNNCPSTPSSSSATSSSAGEGLNQKAGGEGSSASANDNDTTQGVSSSSSSSATASAGDSSSRQTNINTQDQQPVVAPQERVSVWRNIEHALLTFVTSLVPAAPPEIDPAVANVAAAGERM